MIEAIALASAVGSAALAAGATRWLASRSHRPALARIRQLEEDIERERAATRRRAAEETRRHDASLQRLHRALGVGVLGPSNEPVRGKRLAELLRERFGGLLGVDGIAIGDESGLSWSSGDDAEQTPLASSCAAVLGSRFRGALPREVHLELADARHVVVRPMPGTAPLLALAVQSSSRPAPAFALDAAVAHAATLIGDDGDATPAFDPLTGFAAEPTRSTSAVVPQLLRELASEAEHAGTGVLAVGLGDELLAVHAPDGPPGDDLAALDRAMRRLLDQLSHRMAGRARRIDWVSSAGSTASLVTLGATGRSRLLAVRRESRTDSGTFDRLTGRLRRLLPSEPTGAGLSSEPRRS